MAYANWLIHKAVLAQITQTDRKVAPSKSQILLEEVEIDQGLTETAKVLLEHFHIL